MDRSKAAEIHTALNKTLKEFAQQHGLTVCPFNMSFSDVGIKCGIQFGDASKLGDLNVEYVQNLKKFGFMYGLTESHLNTKMKANGKEVIFTGLRNKNKATFTTADGSKMMMDAKAFAQQNGRV